MLVIKKKVRKVKDNNKLGFNCTMLVIKVATEEVRKKYGDSVLIILH